MKRNTLVLVGAILVIAAVWTGVGAMASPQHQQSSATLTARVRALEANVRSLKSQMASTKKKVNQVEGLQKCLTAQGLSQYGDGTTTGYFYTNDAGATVILTHATDFDAGATPTAYMARIDPGCVTGGSERMQNFRYERSATFAPKAHR